MDKFKEFRKTASCEQIHELMETGFIQNADEVVSAAATWKCFKTGEVVCATRDDEKLKKAVQEYSQEMKNKCTKKNSASIHLYKRCQAVRANINEFAKEKCNEIV